MKADVCTCACHTDGNLMHIIACCSKCPKCDERIENSKFLSHVPQCITHRSITLDWAVRILNLYRYRGHNQWYIERNYHYVCGKDQYDMLSHFVAIAIAREYDRVNKDA